MRREMWMKRVGRREGNDVEMNFMMIARYPSFLFFFLLVHEFFTFYIAASLIVTCLTHFLSV
jgi:hypothetical protein